MITVLKANERFHTRTDWLDSWHTFSFADHYDPDRLGFRALRVINDDTVEGGQGFGSHRHRDMEIITYGLDGGLSHRDSSGGGGVIRPGDVQRMSAGSGVVHSEFNASETEPVHFLQIWIVPERRGLKPGYEQKSFPVEERSGKLRLLASRDGRDGSYLSWISIIIAMRTRLTVISRIFWRTPGEMVRSDWSCAREKEL